jgi:hypothetical protein
MATIFKTLETSELKNKYFYRTKQWDWLNKEMIHVFDAATSPRMVTMDPWPQLVYLAATGDKTVAEYIHHFATLYPKNNVPPELDKTILDTIVGLYMDNKLIDISDSAVQLDPTILHAVSKEGKVDLLGTWEGAYEYDVSEGVDKQNFPKVRFTITITEVKNNTFVGTVEDNISDGGMEGIGGINGKFTDETLRFFKFMPFSMTIDQNGKHYVDKTKKHPTLIYEGDFSRSKNHISGQWHFKPKKLLFGLIKLRSSGKGTFMMTKTEK